MRSETRLVVFTNDAVVLSLAAFPYYIGRWNVRSLKTRDVQRLFETESYDLRDRMVLELLCKRREAYQPIEKRLSDIPPGFTPKVNWMECITGDAGHHLYARDTVHPRYSTDEDHQKPIVERIEMLWSKALKVWNGLDGVYDGPRLKTPSVLLLDKIGGDPGKARDAEYLWPIYEEIIINGNELARTPICQVMDRKEVQRSVWEYRPREGLQLSLVEIQQYDGDRAEWRNIRLGKARFNDDALVVGPAFRIVVDGEVVYTKRRKD